MQGLRPPEIMQILDVTDALGLHREAVKIPLMCQGNGSVSVVGTRLQIIAPAEQPFDTWLTTLADTVGALDTSHLQRAE